MEIILKKGGIAECKKWNGDIQDYEFSDISDIAFKFLGDYVAFEEGLTLKDIFILLNKNIDIYNLIFGNWVDEYTEAALTLEPTDDFWDQNTDYLRLYHRIEIEEGELTMAPWPHLDGVGAAKEDDEWHKAGEIVKWAIDFTPIQNLAPLPIKLSDTIEYWNGDAEDKSVEYKFDNYSLFEALHGIIYEVSFHGSIKDSNVRMSELNEQMERIDSGEEEFFSMDEVFSRLDAKISEEKAD